MVNLIGSSRYKINKKQIKNFVQSLYGRYSIAVDSTFNIVFVGKRKMKEIANEYKHEDVALPVLAFPYDPNEHEDKLFGEVIICYPQAVLLAAERNKKVETMMEQLIEHGIRNVVTNSSTHL